MKGSRRSLAGRAFRAALLMLGAAVACAALSWWLVDWTDDGADAYPGGKIVYDAFGNVLRVSLGEGDVDCRPFYMADPGDWIVKALVAAEDGEFWSHCGVRPLSVLRAACQNVFYRRRISGASTITMQAVRLIKPHPKTLLWKWREAVMAMKMERRRDKRWIISQYLNRAPYGSNFVGVEAAAHGWFGKSAKELGLGEAAILAGMVQAPSRFRPDRGLARALKRRDYVLERMRALGLADDGQIAAAKSVVPVVCRDPRPFLAPHFCDWVLKCEGIDRPAQRTCGEVRTSLDADIQAMCEHAVNEAAAGGGWSCAAVVMRVETGAVVALACSGGYFDPVGGQVNTALAPRPAGSTLKPFLAALAMDAGLVTPEERLPDVPASYKGYRPANFDAQHRGLVSARDALVLSLNIPFVQLLGRVGTDRFGAALRGMGLSHMQSPDETFGLGMAIGNVEVTLLELTAAYSAVARGALQLPAPARAPGAVSVADAVFSPAACYLVSDMLSGSERSSAALGHVADVATSRFAWKTGTSSAYRDAWTVAWNPEYAVGVWCGHKSGGFGDRSLVGAKAAAPVAWTIARALYPGNDGPWFGEPPGIVRRPVCSLTGLPAGPDCPATETGRAISGRSRSAPCPAHCRDANGEPVERLDAFLAAFSGAAKKAQRLSISRPEDGAEFALVDGMAQQRIVCQAVGNPEGSRLWWFVDGVAAGETEGSRPIALEMAVGGHTVSCATVDGVSASVKIKVHGGGDI